MAKKLKTIIKAFNSNGQYILELENVYPKALESLNNDKLKVISFGINID
jgi:hypothetical protein